MYDKFSVIETIQPLRYVCARVCISLKAKKMF